MRRLGIIDIVARIKAFVAQHALRDELRIEIVALFGVFFEEGFDFTQLGGALLDLADAAG